MKNSIPKGHTFKVGHFIILSPRSHHRCQGYPVQFNHNNPSRMFLASLRDALCKEIVTARGVLGDGIIAIVLNHMSPSQATRLSMLYVCAWCRMPTPWRQCGSCLPSSTSLCCDVV